MRLRLRRGVAKTARHGRRFRVRSRNRTKATASTARRRRTSRRPSTCPPTPGRRSACGSGTPRTRPPRATRTAVPDGIFVDEIAITAGATTVFSDGAETSPNGWTLAGWSSVGASTSALFDNYYIAGHRSYVSYDKYLKSGPYYFGYQNTLPDKVDHYAYQQGLLISYWDTSYADNDTFAHPGSGRNLYVDAHPVPFYKLDGLPWRARIQVYDAPFGLKKADSFNAARPVQAGVHPWPGCATAVRRHRQVLVRRAAEPRREAACRGSQDPGAGGRRHDHEDPCDVLILGPRGRYDARGQVPRASSQCPVGEMRALKPWSRCVLGKAPARPQTGRLRSVGNAARCVPGLRG